MGTLIFLGSVENEDPANKDPLQDPLKTGDPLQKEDPFVKSTIKDVFVLRTKTPKSKKLEN